VLPACPRPTSAAHKDGPIFFCGMRPEIPVRKPLLLRKGFWFAFALIVPLVGCVAWVTEDIYGRRQLAETKTRLRAAGLDLSARTLWPARALESENFCPPPVVSRVLSAHSGRMPIKRLAANLDCLVPYRLSGLGSSAPTDWSRLWGATRSGSRSRSIAAPAELLTQISEDSPHPDRELGVALEARENIFFLETGDWVWQYL
jgi:hypothetical protein